MVAVREVKATAESGEQVTRWLCRRCRLPVPGNGAAALLVCPDCGLVHELIDGGLSVTTPLIACRSTRHPVPGEVHYLAAWRLVVDVDEPGDPTWPKVAKQAAPALPYLYVPAFSSNRSVLQQLGFRLTETQPRLEPSLEGVPSPRPGWATQGQPDHLSVSGVHGGSRCSWPPREEDGSSFGLFSPVVISRQDSRVLSHFVYLVLRSGDTRELDVVDYRLDVVTEEFVYIPAVQDPRCVREAGWRLLLHEFDDLVA